MRKGQPWSRQQETGEARLNRPCVKKKKKKDLSRILTSKQLQQIKQ